MGFTVTSAAAYLGGHLVFAHKIGVDRSPEVGLPEDFVPVIHEREIPENQLYRVEVNNIPVLMVRKAGRIYALAETCAHMSGPLSEGTLTEGNAVECPWHGSRFSLEDGHVLRGPSTYSQPCFDVRVREGQVEIRFEKITAS
jgi:nitrite reductase/ring-hydroxylating ferredoxin subunit